MIEIPLTAFAFAAAYCAWLWHRVELRKQELSDQSALELATQSSNRSLAIGIELRDRIARLESHSAAPAPELAAMRRVLDDFVPRFDQVEKDVRTIKSAGALKSASGRS